jgi:hypothetical protein
MQRMQAQNIRRQPEKIAPALAACVGMFREMILKSVFPEQMQLKT